MTGAELSGAGLCEACGTALTGKFCSGCGAPAKIAAPEGWSALTNQLLGKPDRNGIFSVVVAFLRHPVDTIIRLTDDPTYRSQWAFLSSCVGAQLMLTYVLLPRLYAVAFSVPDTANSSAVVTNEIVQYVGIAILTPIQFYLCRTLGTRRRTPMSYVKLCVLSVSYCAIVSMVAALLIFVMGVLALTAGAAIDMHLVWLGLTSATMIAIVAFVTASHRRFWGMSWPIALGVTLVIAVLSWSVVYPGLTAIAEKANVSGTLGRLLG